MLTDLVVEANQVSDDGNDLINSLIDGRPELLSPKRTEVALDDGALLEFADINEGELDAGGVQSMRNALAVGWQSLPTWMVKFWPQVPPGSRSHMALPRA